MSDKTPDTTGLREATPCRGHGGVIYTYDGPQFGAQVIEESCDECGGWHERHAAAHPTPDASPAPAVVQVQRLDDWLTDNWRPAEAYDLSRCLAAAGFGDVRAIEAERDRASAGRDLWRQSHALMRQRAEAAEKELADLRERVEAVKPVTLSHGWAGYRSEFVPLTELRAALNPGAGACTCGAAEHGAMAQHLRPCPEAGA